MVLLDILNASSIGRILIELIGVGGILFSILWTIFNKVIGQKADKSMLENVDSKFEQYKLTHKETHKNETKMFTNEINHQTKMFTNEINHQTELINEVLTLSEHIKQTLDEYRKESINLWKESRDKMKDIAKEQVEIHQDSKYHS